MAVEHLGPVFRLVYRSRTTIAPTRRGTELDALFETARRNNAALAVTGALLVWEDAFVQVLEGDEAVVRPLYDRIRGDPRHERVVLLDADHVPDRVFARWSMARVADDDGADLPAHRDREAPGPPAAAPGLDDDRQEMMLDFMREYARPDVQPL